MSFYLEVDGIQESHTGSGVHYQNDCYFDNVQLASGLTTGPSLTVDPTTKKLYLAEISPLTTNGDIFTFTAGTIARLAAGTANQYLEIDPNSSLPKWISQHLGYLTLTDNATATTATTATVPAGAWALGSASTTAFAMASDGVLSYTGPPGHIFLVTWEINFTVAAADGTVTVWIYHNGSANIIASKRLVTATSTTSVYALSGSSPLPLATGDTIQISILSSSPTNQNVTVVEGQLNVFSLF